MQLELRNDPIVDRWVGIVIDKPSRPKDFFIPEFTWRGNDGCPFCLGNENLTPEAVAVYPSLDNKLWDVRVVANKFPALIDNGYFQQVNRGMYNFSNGLGIHEVIIETPQHYKWFSDLDDSQIINIIKAYRERSLELRKDKRFKYILIFKNVGPEAGASLEHGHSQLVTLPIIPKSVKEELAGISNYYDLNQRCLFCDILAYEQKEDKRVVFSNDEFIAFCPFASRFSFETWLAPIKHSDDFANIEDSSISKLAQVLKQTIGRLKEVLGPHSYNLVLHTIPVNNQDYTQYHWHIEIMPKLTIASALEWARAFYIVYTPPELAAKYLSEKNT